MPDFLLIDGSYYVFYRYHALKQWWKHARSEEKLENPCENVEFMERFKKVFVSKISEVVEKLKLTTPLIVVAKDCPRQDIWRMEHFPDYKKGRVCDENIGGVFSGYCAILGIIFMLIIYLGPYFLGLHQLFKRWLKAFPISGWSFLV